MLGNKTVFLWLSLVRGKTDTLLTESVQYIYIYLIGCFGVQYHCIFLRVLQYFDEPAGRVKMQRTSKNMQRYCTPEHLILKKESY